MMHLAHRAALCPSGARIAGYRLRPATVGQMRLLEVHGIPLVPSEFDAAPEWTDLAMALSIMRFPWHLVRRLSCSSVGRWLLVAVSHKAIARDPGGVADALAEWIDSNNWMPRRVKCDSAGGTPSPEADEYASSEWMGICARLAAVRWRDQSARDYRTVFDMPVLEARAILCAANECEGAHYMSRKWLQREEENQ